MIQAMFQVTTDMVVAPASRSRYSGPDFPPDVQEGRHRRVYPELVVHLVFDDLSELSLGSDSAVARSLGHLASWLVER
jgi:hypothetical protein